MVSRCLEPVMKHEARVFSNETIRNYAVTCFLKSTMINYAVLHYCPPPNEHVYMHSELLLCSWRPTMSEEGA